MRLKLRPCLEDRLPHVEVWLGVMHLHQDALLCFGLAHDVEAATRLLHHVQHHEVERVISVLAVPVVPASAAGAHY